VIICNREILKFPGFLPTFFVELISLNWALLSDVKYRFAAIYLFGEGSLRPTNGHKKEKDMHNEKGNFHLPMGSLYTPLPVPAYQVLGTNREYQAQKLLLCLASYMGKNNNCVFPSYLTIKRACGMSKSTISEALDVLHDYGFIKIFKYRVGKESRSKYYLQLSCWNTQFMSPETKQHRKIIARCEACGKGIDRGSFGVSPLGFVHWGCGGYVHYLPSYKKRRN
jgi:hypothetical protein